MTYLSILISSPRQPRRHILTSALRSPLVRGMPGFLKSSAVAFLWRSVLMTESCSHHLVLKSAEHQPGAPWMRERLDICSKTQWSAIQKPSPIPFSLLHTTSILHSPIYKAGCSGNQWPSSGQRDIRKSVLKDAEKDDLSPCNRDVGRDGSSSWPPLHFLALNEVIMAGAAAAIV